MEKEVLSPIHTNNYAEYLSLLNSYLGRIENKKILEAGCGSSSNLKFNNCEIYGIDISKEQLDKNQIINHKILGDLTTYSNPDWENKFDIIVCWDVLEHLKFPSNAINNFKLWIKKEGIIVLAFPIYNSLTGLLTKYTPIYLHYLGRFLVNRKYYKNLSLFSIWKISKSSTFPTVFHPILKINTFLKFINEIGLKVELFLTIESDKNSLIRKLLGNKIYLFMWKLLNNNNNIEISPYATDIIIVLKK